MHKLFLFICALLFAVLLSMMVKAVKEAPLPEPAQDGHLCFNQFENFCLDEE